MCITSITKHLVVGLVLVTLFSCKKSELPELVVAPYDDLELVYSVQQGIRFKEKFALGRNLFYDKSLSSDQTISCGSCHKQEYAFSDAGNAFSKGVEGRLGKRNSPALMNLAWSKSFMVDGGINHLEIMPLAPITDSLEMNLSMSELLSRLNNSSYYKLMFSQLFETDSITDYHFYKALAVFTSSLNSFDSKYDLHLKGKKMLSERELSGYLVFKQYCTSCHSGSLFTNQEFSVNKSHPSNNDIGRAKVSGNTSDKFAFKVPSLRNVALTGPYFHDGSKESLQSVVEHYQGYFKEKNGVSFSDEESVQLLSFLGSLTDQTFISNTKYSNPYE